MRPIKSLIDILTGKRSSVVGNIGGTGVYLTNRVNHLTSRRARLFFNHSIICSVTDAYEYFLHIDSENNIFYKSIDFLTEKVGERFIMWESAFHTLMFTKDMGNSGESAEYEVSLFFLYDFLESEKNAYYEFKRCLLEDETRFLMDFARASFLAIFDFKEMTSLDISFVYNFYYNCYTDFYKSYAKYALNSDLHREGESVCLEVGQKTS